MPGKAPDSLSVDVGYPHRDSLKYLAACEVRRVEVVRVIIEGNRVTLEFEDAEKRDKFVDFLRSIGVSGDIVKREIRIEYDEKFWEYLVKDRGLDARTAKWYMNYLRKLAGKAINYDLYLEICDNRWMVKLVRIYLDYLEKTGRISWEEKERLKSIFRVKKSDSDEDEYKIDAENPITTMSSLREGLYKLILELLLYSGVRLSEVVKMLCEWDEDRLECFNAFCMYKLKWRRGRKRCDYIFFPKRLLPKILRYAHRVGKYENLRKNIYDYYGIKPKDLRKLHYRLCCRIMDKEVCEFYQSRIGKLDTSDKHYDELLTKATKNCPKFSYYILLNTIIEIL